jgi:hypothetical protein
MFHGSDIVCLGVHTYCGRQQKCPSILLLPTEGGVHFSIPEVCVAMWLALQMRQKQRHRETWPSAVPNPWVCYMNKSTERQDPLLPRAWKPADIWVIIWVILDQPATIELMTDARASPEEMGQTMSDQNSTASHQIVRNSTWWFLKATKLEGYCHAAIINRHVYVYRCSVTYTPIILFLFYFVSYMGSSMYCGC